MASKNLVLKGATWNGVESVDFPVSGGGTARFVETSDADATASDIANGKTAYVNGSLITGTASGGGGSLVWGTIRDDATLVKSWTYDKLIYADEGIPIPAYTTSDTTLKSGSTLETASMNFSDYSYLLIYRLLAMPIYSNTTKSAGREIYWAYSGVNRYVFTPASAFSHDGTNADVQSSQYSAIGAQSNYRTVYYNSATAVRYTQSNYGAYMGVTNPSAQSPSSPSYNTSTLTITAPSLKIRGNSTYLNSTNWEYITDIRYQYIYDLYSVPQSSAVHGWETESQFRHILDCANGTGTLT